MANANDPGSAAEPAPTTDEARAASLAGVVEEHLDDAEFLFLQRERALDSPAYTLDDLEDREEERLLADVDGLVVAGARARDALLLPAIAEGAPARAAAAALALLASGEADATRAVIDALDGDDEARRGAVGRALAIAPQGDLDARLVARAGRAEGATLAALVEVLAARGAHAGPRLLDVGLGAEPPLLVAALRAGRVGGGEPHAWLARELVASTAPAVRAEAITTGVVLGVPEAWDACRQAVRAGDADDTCLLLAAMVGDARDLEAIVDATLSAGSRAGALFALGFSGRVAAADACLARVDDEDEDVARLAGEAFVAITGYAIVHGATVPPPERDDDPPGFVRRVRAEDALPRLDAARARAFWAKARARFDAKGRALHGAPFGATSLRAALERGPLRRRHALALELAIRTRGRLRVGTRALASRQRADLAALASLTDAELAPSA